MYCWFHSEVTLPTRFSLYSELKPKIFSYKRINPTITPQLILLNKYTELFMVHKDQKTKQQKENI